MLEYGTYPTYANYTERFADWIKNEAKRNGLNGDEELEVILSAVFPSIIAAMPTDDSGNNFSYRLYLRYCTREIGTETEDLFLIYLQNAAIEAYSLYAKKIEQYKLKFEKAADSKETFQTTNTVEKITSIDSEYLNPANAQAKVLNGQKQSVIEPQRAVETREEHVSAASHTTLLREQMELRVIYEDAVAYFDKLFMKVY